MVNKKSFIKNLVISDLHIPYHDDKAIEIMLKYGKKYSPHNIVINGDFLDFYKLSNFDQDPDRRDSVAQELIKGKNMLKKIRETFPKAEIYFLHGNHENRLQRYFWRNPELNGIDSLELGKLLNFKEFKIKEVKVSRDYWAKDSGHLKIGDLLIMHGDSKLNGASLSKYSGYSAKNTMSGVQSSVLIGHCHRLALVYHKSSSLNMKGIESGCLCQVPGKANWQQGFVTFETHKGKNFNYRLHNIENGCLINENITR